MYDHHEEDKTPIRAVFSFADDDEEIRPPKTNFMLSANAQEFVPTHNTNSIQDRLLQNQMGGNYYHHNNAHNTQYQSRHRHNGYHQPNNYQNNYQRHSRHHNMNHTRNYQSHHDQHQSQMMAAQISQCTSSVQNRLRIGDSKDKTNSYNQQQNCQPPAASTPEVETIAIDYLQGCITCLNDNPGQFDTIATRFLTIYEGLENNCNVIAIAMEIIFEESIKKPNFRYMGAKLYNLLHMLNLKKDSLFHLLLEAKLNHHQDEMMSKMRSNQEQMVRETALFLAELYMQLRGDDTRILLIAENIMRTLKLLISKETADNVRCICLTLKLAGFDLTKDCPAEMQEIINILDGINQKNPGKYPLAVSVISLQKNNWGRKCSSSNSFSESEKIPEPLRTSDEPIFYGPDGRELTAEEAEFLQGGATGGGSTDDEDLTELEVDFDPEMDEEAEKAFKEFRQQKRS
ncbi:polyadenylate-binding protein-interacting protein 1-like [Teleopsis dalmanni]|uniref:polyadenylate-binding protein-interacting protein 1-like n=1 Tax=Teleopsis dalmanni TaxID=139649 RepID=UPI0018CCEFED|nr:polyadenylate-binding protein-interacting protein 1-like [Teleopsis dalmanni]XP_037946671.1 polyadenylate-binding protein-interacting protein 1-like [Teleopsis dalmanni]